MKVKIIKKLCQCSVQILVSDFSIKPGLESLKIKFTFPSFSILSTMKIFFSGQQKQSNLIDNHLSHDEKGDESVILKYREEKSNNST